VLAQVPDGAQLAHGAVDGGRLAVRVLAGHGLAAARRVRELSPGFSHQAIVGPGQHVQQ
jgi:hypothetical protein